MTEDAPGPGDCPEPGTGETWIKLPVGQPRLVQAFETRECPGCGRLHTIPAFPMPPAEAIAVDCTCGAHVTYGRFDTSISR